MEIVLVRHALPERVDGEPGGVAADPGLTGRGHAQAARVVDALRGEQVDAVYVSPATRARQTAAPLAAARGLEPVVLQGLSEFDRGHVTYVPVEELKAAGGAEWEALKRGELGALGIDPVAFRAGVVAAVEQVVAAHPGGRAVLFSHAGSLNAVTGHVLGLDRALWFAPAYASLTRLGASRDGRRGIVSLNETGHVRDLLA